MGEHISFVKLQTPAIMTKNILVLCSLVIFVIALTAEAKKGKKGKKGKGGSGSREDSSEESWEGSWSGSWESSEESKESNGWCLSTCWCSPGTGATTTTTTTAWPQRFGRAGRLEAERWSKASWDSWCLDVCGCTWTDTTTTPTTTTTTTTVSTFPPRGLP